MSGNSTARDHLTVITNNPAPKKGGRVRRAPNMNTATWRKSRTLEIARQFGAEVGLKPSEILADKANLTTINQMIEEEIAEAKKQAMRIVKEKLALAATGTFVPPAPQVTTTAPATTTPPAPVPVPEKAAAKKADVIQTKEEIEAGIALALKRAEEKEKAVGTISTPTPIDPFNSLRTVTRQLVKNTAENDSLVNGFVEALKAASWERPITWEHFSACYGWLVWVLKNRPDMAKKKVEEILNFIKEVLRMEGRTGEKTTPEFYYLLIAERGLADKAFPLLMKDEAIQKETQKAEKKAQKKAKDAARQARKRAEAQRQSVEALACKGGKKKKDR